MRKYIFISLLILSLFVLQAQTCTMTSGVATECQGVGEIVCDDDKAYECALGAAGYYAVRAEEHDVDECGATADTGDLEDYEDRIAELLAEIEDIETQIEALLDELLDLQILYADGDITAAEYEAAVSEIYEELLALLQQADGIRDELIEIAQALAAMDESDALSAVQDALDELEAAFAELEAALEAAAEEIGEVLRGISEADATAVLNALDADIDNLDADVTAWAAEIVVLVNAISPTVTLYTDGTITAEELVVELEEFLVGLREGKAVGVTLLETWNTLDARLGVYEADSAYASYTTQLSDMDTKLTLIYDTIIDTRAETSAGITATRDAIAYTDATTQLTALFEQIQLAEAGAADGEVGYDGVDSGITPSYDDYADGLISANEWETYLLAALETLDDLKVELDTVEELLTLSQETLDDMYADSVFSSRTSELDSLQTYIDDVTTDVDTLGDEIKTLVETLEAYLSDLGEDPTLAAHCAGPYEYGFGETVEFDGSLTRGEHIIEYMWYYGDSRDSGLLSADGDYGSDYVYGATGSYTATLQIWDHDSNSDTCTASVTITS